jgi:hypothetical protein
VIQLKLLVDHNLGKPVADALNKLGDLCPVMVAHAALAALQAEEKDGR